MGKTLLVAGALLGVSWLAFWIIGVGVLVNSEPTRLQIGRTCHYLVGVTVVKKLTPASRCEVVRSGV